MKLVRPLPGVYLDEAKTPLVVIGAEMARTKTVEKDVVTELDTLCLICILSDGTIFWAEAPNVKITVDKELRELLAEAKLTS